ncbi:MAG: tRNA (guanosine(46)-N7)-methyltransferase TrmB [Clostridia bacterium]|nr:tRNA (guanosine(46)-N7)-methyltransferase TrmB [Clostridia bacterium]
MRKKKNLLPRLEAVSDFFIKDISEFEDFSNIYLEIGCGKGTFITESAKRNPKRQYVAIEKVSSVILLAAEKAARENLKNVRFYLGDAENLRDLKNSNFCDKIFLNFSDPWPRTRHAKRRLTADGFLELYKKLLSSDGEIQMKTDNTELFDFSLETFPANGFELSEVTRDLHAEVAPWNIVTEYEQNFVSQGVPIKRLVAKLQ